MVFKLLIVFLISVSLQQVAYSAKTCVADAAELANQISSFPKFVQGTPPIMFIRESLPVAALSFYVADGRINGEATYKILFGVTRDYGYVSKLCYDGTELIITLEIRTGRDQVKQKELKVKVINDSTIEYSGFEFKQSTPAEFAKVLNKLNGSKKNSDVAPPSMTGVQ